MRAMTLPPGPALHPAAQIALWAFRPISFLTSCAQRFGDTFTVRFPGYPPLVFTSDPAAVSEILAGDPGTFLTGQGNRILKPLLGEESLLLLDGEHHKQRRRLVMPPFHGPAMRAAADAMGAAARRHLERWPTGRPFPVQPAFAALTLDVIVETVIGVRENDRRAELCGRLTRLLSLGTHPSVFFFVGRGFPPPARLLFSACFALFSFAYGFLVCYVWGDARRRGMRHRIWALVAALVPNGLGFLAYFLLREPVLRRCGSCGTAVRRDLAFCPQCGAGLARACPSCRKLIEPDWGHCAHCGAKL